MAIQDDEPESSTNVGSVEPDIKPAELQHAEDIVAAFNEEYVKYYGKYVDDNRLRDFIAEMPEEVDNTDLPEEMIWTVENSDNSEFIGAGAIKFDDNLAELGSTIIVPEYRERESTSGNGLYDELFRQRVDTASELVEQGSIDLVNTQLLADKSAATQHTADKHDFAVTGVYDKKFPVAYEGKGRVTVVDMLWADSNIENDQNEVYLPEDAEGLADAALDNIEDKRSDDLESISREVLNDSREADSQRYSVKTKAVDTPEEDPMNFAEVSIVADETGEYSWNDVLTEISRAQEQVTEDDDYWVGVSMDVNNPFSVDAALELSDLGFEYAGFNPGKLDAGNENRDALEMQYRPSESTYVKQFVNEAVDFMDEAGMDYRKAAEQTHYESSQALEV